jgi:hypothetical protein
MPHGRCKPPENVLAKARMARHNKKNGFVSKDQPLVQPFFNFDDLGAFPIETESAAKILNDYFAGLSGSPDPAIRTVVEAFRYLASELVETRLTLLAVARKKSTNTGVSEMWARRRDAEIFKINSSTKGRFELQGWKALLEYTGLQEKYLRNKFCNGKGVFQPTIFRGKDCTEPERMRIERPSQVKPKKAL